MIFRNFAFLLLSTSLAVTLANPIPVSHPQDQILGLDNVKAINFNLPPFEKRTLQDGIIPLGQSGRIKDHQDYEDLQLLILDRRDELHGQIQATSQLSPDSASLNVNTAIDTTASAPPPPPPAVAADITSSDSNKAVSIDAQVLSSDSNKAVSVDAQVLPSTPSVDNTPSTPLSANAIPDVAPATSEEKPPMIDATTGLPTLDPVTGYPIITAEIAPKESAPAVVATTGFGARFAYFASGGAAIGTVAGAAVGGILGAVVGGVIGIVVGIVAAIANNYA